MAGSLEKFQVNWNFPEKGPIFGHFFKSGGPIGKSAKNGTFENQGIWFSNDKNRQNGDFCRPFLIKTGQKCGQR